MVKYTILILLAVAFAFAGCKTEPANPKAKYVFLFIGDGMGPNQVYLSEAYLGALQNQIGIVPLGMSKFPVNTLVTTYSAKNLITCSSAAGTALATGNKTKNGVLGLDTSLTIHFESIAEKAQKKGFKIGIVSSVGINHATPASFYANTKSRRDYYTVAQQMAESGFTYFGGGGFMDAQPADTIQSAYDYAKSLGYTVTTTLAGFDSLKMGMDKVYAVNPILLTEAEMPWTLDSVSGSLTLADFTRKGIELLQNEKGFFMMVEGGKIDWACHSNDAVSSIYETLAFDEAIQVAIDFYKQHPDETLILVTADHETGGITLGNEESNYNLKLKLLAHQKASIEEFTNTVNAMKSNGAKVSFESLLDTLKNYTGLGSIDLPLSDAELKNLKQLYKTEFANSSVEQKGSYLDVGSDFDLVSYSIYLLNNAAGVGWISHDHTGMQVPLRAMGVGQELFMPRIDNTDIPKNIETIMF